MHVLARNGCHGKGLYWQGLCSLSLSLAALPSVEFMCCRVYKVPQRAAREGLGRQLSWENLSCVYMRT